MMLASHLDPGRPAERRIRSRHSRAQYGMDAHFQIPQITHFAVFHFGVHGVVIVLGLSIHLELETTLVGKMQQTDEAETCADFVHLVFRIRLVQTGNDGCE